ncbi:hypothetical protein A0U90_06580 [Kozakia baliensis]|nr:hypothetical protein A0U90_06580 [Kozakia baliensis]
MAQAPIRLELKAVRQLLLLRERRNDQARRALSETLRQIDLCQAQRQDARVSLAAHRKAWMELEQDIATQSHNVQMKGFEFQRNRARLDAMADQAARLQDRINETDKTLATMQENAAEARHVFMKTEQRTHQAQDLLTGAKATLATERSMREEQELEDLNMARHNATLCRERSAQRKKLLSRLNTPADERQKRMSASP